MTTMQYKYFCPCCGYDTFEEEPSGTYDICPICFWEDDPIQLKDPDYEGGANQVSLRQAQINFDNFGACVEGLIRNVIKPDKSYKRNPQWKIK
jgi:hypothetical protein